MVYMMPDNSWMSVKQRAEEKRQGEKRVVDFYKPAHGIVRCSFASPWGGRLSIGVEELGYAGVVCKSARIKCQDGEAFVAWREDGNRWAKKRPRPVPRRRQDVIHGARETKLEIWSASGASPGSRSRLAAIGHVGPVWGLFFCAHFWSSFVIDQLPTGEFSAARRSCGQGRLVRFPHVSYHCMVVRAWHALDQQDGCFVDGLRR
ncbi:hypothetical protein B0I35DRAFT_186491 [Stachybotrys elegans]|uniref:Uncharacterized protein n=1 Tax=Stachybotrys elegans TaxID=80388 RepID=A0A8K0WUM9_9HYPO|nr:hypothetical protein B0I35DRAFT_186491 [Stachybotrys elegans]